MVAVWVLYVIQNDTGLTACVNNSCRHRYITALQSQKAVSAYIKFKQILPFGLAWQYTHGCTDGNHEVTVTIFLSLMSEYNLCNRSHLVTDQSNCWPRCSAGTIRWPNVGLMLVQRHRRWADIKPSLVQRLVFAGYYTHAKLKSS